MHSEFQDFQIEHQFDVLITNAQAAFKHGLREYAK